MYIYRRSPVGTKIADFQRKPVEILNPAMRTEVHLVGAVGQRKRRGWREDEGAHASWVGPVLLQTSCCWPIAVP